MTEAAPLPEAAAVIVGVGARSPSGLTALQVTMSARAAYFVPRPSHLVDRNGDPIATARLASIADNVMGLPRFVVLAVPPLIQAAHAWMEDRRSRSRQVAPIPLFLALPSVDRPGVDPRLEKDLLPLLAERTRLPIDLERSVLVRECRGGGALAMELAMAALAKDEHEGALVGGVDTYFDPDVLEHLDVERRLHGPETENGFVPGEAAAFVMLTSRRRATNLSRLGQVLSAAVEMEPHPFGSDEPCLAEGLTKVLRRAAATSVGARAGRIPWALTDVANERHRVDEWAFAEGRLHKAFTPDHVHDQPLLKTGDVGAASTALLVTMAVTRWDTACADGDVALVATSSDGPPPARPGRDAAGSGRTSALRGAVVVSQDPG